jgi:DNA polymerase-3 subunit alpha
LAYSFIGFQTAYIATRWNPIYWDSACLVVNSGSLEDNSEEEIVDIYYQEMQDLQEGITFEDLPDRSGKIRKTTSTDYIKVAKALGDIIASGIKISLVDINKSDYGFQPDVENNQILFGMKALNSVGIPIINEIKANRPYSSINDFLNKTNINKTAMISLIKSGAFDNLVQPVSNYNSRQVAMATYLSISCKPKKKLTLQNFNGLIQEKMIPDDFKKQKEIFIFNKFLKKQKHGDFYYFSGEKLIQWFENTLSLDEIDSVVNNVYFIKQEHWENIYKNNMDIIKKWIKDNHDTLLKIYNQKLFKEEWNKYAEGTISSWEMSALCFYYHEHELINVNKNKYGIVDFNKLSQQPTIEYFYKEKIPIYKLYRIAGTAIAKNDTKHIVTLLTTSGIVNVKFTRDFYAMYNRQISEMQKDGSKEVKEKGWFSRGTKLLVTGFRRDDTFVAKCYKNAPGHTLYKILNTMKNGDIELISSRYCAMQ